MLKEYNSPNPLTIITIEPDLITSKLAEEPLKPSVKQIKADQDNITNLESKMPNSDTINFDKYNTKGKEQGNTVEEDDIKNKLEKLKKG